MENEIWRVGRLRWSERNNVHRSLVTVRGECRKEYNY